MLIQVITPNGSQHYEAPALNGNTVQVEREVPAAEVAQRLRKELEQFGGPPLLFQPIVNPAQ